MIDYQSPPNQKKTPTDGNSIIITRTQTIRPFSNSLSVKKTSQSQKDKTSLNNLVVVQDQSSHCSDPQQNSTVVKKFNHELQSYNGQESEPENIMQKSDGFHSFKSPSERGAGSLCKLNSNIYNIAFGQSQNKVQTIEIDRRKPEIKVRSSSNNKPNLVDPLREQEGKLEKQINQIKKDLQTLRVRRKSHKNVKFNQTFSVIKAETIYEYSQRMKNAGGWGTAERAIDELTKSQTNWKIQSTQDIGILARPNNTFVSKQMASTNIASRQLTFAGSDDEYSDNYQLRQKERIQKKIYSRQPLGNNIIKVKEQPSILKSKKLNKSQQRIRLSLDNMNMPKLPQMPDKESKPKDLIEFGRNLFSLFGVCQQQEKIPLTVSKYNNCLSFVTNDLTILWYDTGRFYIGGYRLIQNEGQKHGKGVELMPRKYLYDGEYKTNKKSGYGCLRYTNGNSYEGQFFSGMKYGKGRLIHTDGTIYDGQWKNQKMDGFGVLHLASGDQYEGYFECGTQHGFGVLKFFNGDSYKGEFTQGRFFGKGIYTWATGQIYEGEFVNGCKHGQGVWKSKESQEDMYIGEYKNDKKCGIGKYIWKDGTVYEGEFENDQRHGVGMIIEKGKATRGIWENGKQTRSLQPEQNSDDLRAYYKNAHLQKHPAEIKRIHSKSLKKSVEMKKNLSPSESKTLSSMSQNKVHLSGAAYKPMQFYRRLGITG